MKILTATLTLIFALAMPAISRAQCHESDCCDIQTAKATTAAHTQIKGITAATTTIW